MKHLQTFENFEDNIMIIHLTIKSVKSFLKELKNNGISFEMVRDTVVRVAPSPKVNMAIKLTRERWGNSEIMVK